MFAQAHTICQGEEEREVEGEGPPLEITIFYDFQRFLMCFRDWGGFPEVPQTWLGMGKHEVWLGITQHQ